MRKHETEKAILHDAQMKRCWRSGRSSPTWRAACAPLDEKRRIGVILHRHSC